MCKKRAAEKALTRSWPPGGTGASVAGLENPLARQIESERPPTVSAGYRYYCIAELQAPIREADRVSEALKLTFEDDA